MHNYIDKWTCIGMMNKNCSLSGIDGILSFNKTKSGSKAVAFSLDYEFNPLVHKHVSWMYLDEEPDKTMFDSIYSLEEIVSVIDCNAMFWNGEKRPKCCLSGKSMKEWRDTVNKWDRALCNGTLKIEKLDFGNEDETVNMIEKWRYLENGGMKYGWQERAGCDKALVHRYVNNFESIQDFVIGQVFKLDNEVIGYSCIEKHSLCKVDNIPEFKYLTRKALNVEGRRNLTEYIDYKTIESAWKCNDHLQELLVNWGASSGGVHWYKTHKFPLYSIEKKWFASKKAK